MANASQRQRRQSLFGIGFLLQAIHTWLLNGSSPMTNLTQQGVDLVWDDACEGAFKTLKAALMSATVLAYPTREGHFTLSTDASDVGIGAVLEQDQEQGGQVVKRVIAYARPSATRNDVTAPPIKNCWQS